MRISVLPSKPGLGLRALLFAAVAAFAVAGPPAGDAAAAGGAVRLATSLEASCPCAGPAAGGIWSNPKDYRDCARRHLRGLAQSGQAARRAVRKAYRRALASSCGETLPLEHNVEVCGEGIVLPCETVATAHVDECTECEAAFSGELIECALYRNGAGAQATACGDDLPASRGEGRVVERRTGLDCGSCLAKLGSEPAPGVTCLRASCGPL